MLAEQSTGVPVFNPNRGRRTMCEFKKFSATALCIAALALTSCGTTGSNQTVAVASVSPAVVSPTESLPVATQVTVGTLTDPCSLGRYDPWWIDHGGNVEFHRRCG
jgi:hypothetical protein